MRYSKIGLLATAVSAFALLSTTTAQASASLYAGNEMGLLQPRSFWQVGAINAPNAEYCAMVNRFDKDISLAVARGADGSGSLAINFPNDVLEADATYDITLKLQGQQNRDFSVRASSETSLVIQIGQDEEFFTALSNDGILSIALPTLEMKFDMQKFSASYITLIACADRLPVNADTGPKTAAMPVPPVEKTSLAASSSSGVVASPACPAGEQVSRLSLQNQELLSENSQLKLTKSELMAKLDSQGKVSAASAANDKMVTELQTQVSACKTQSAQQTQALMSENNQLKTEKRDLLARLDLKDKQYASLQDMLTSKDKDLNVARELSSSNSQTAQDLQVQVGTYKQQVETYQSQVTNLQADLLKTRQENSQAVALLQAQLAEKTSLYENLQKQMSSLTDARHAMEVQMSGLQMNLEQSKSQLASAQKLKESMATQMVNASRESQTVIDRLNEQLRKNSEQIASLENQMISVSLQRDDMRAQLNTETNKNRMLQLALEQKERELGQAIAMTATWAQAQKRYAAALPAPPRQIPVFTGANAQAFEAEAKAAENKVPSTLPPPLFTARDAKAAPAVASGKSFFQNIFSSSDKAARPAITSSKDDNWETVIIQ